MILKNNPTSIDSPKVPDAGCEKWGSTAVATVGAVTVEVEESLAVSKWQLCIECPSLYLRLGIAGPDIIARLHDFLTGARGAAIDKFPLGCFGTQNVQVLRDDESAHRFFIVIGGDENSSLRVTLADEPARQWVQAIEDVRDQLCQ